ncbi:MAG: Uma2 family endonuclease [Isosphaeraceae bacterium]
MSVADFTLTEDAPPVTIEEFLALPDNGVHRELIQGRVRELGMTVRNRFHSRIEARVGQKLLNWLDQQPPPRGEVVCGEADFRLKGTKESLVGIDVALVSADLVARTDKRETMYDGAPILAVEILSPSDRHDDTVDTVASYLELGTVVWMIDADFQILTVFQPTEKPRAYNLDDELCAEPYLPGLRVPIAELLG